MKALVTGGAGFIGFHLAKYLASEGYGVTICDNLSHGQRDEEFNDLVARDNIRFIEIDLCQRHQLDKLGAELDVVYHLAAVTATHLFYEIPQVVIRTNLLSQINILDWAVEAKCPRLVWASSSEAYAGTTMIGFAPIPTPESVPLTVADVFNPRFSYIASKIAGEVLAINYSRAHGFSLAIVRPHNIYGPRMGLEHVIPQFIKRILDRENPFKIYGADETRSFCYIDDLVWGLRLAGESSRLESQVILNIGNDHEIRITELAQKMFDLFDFHPQLELLPSRPGSVERRCPDISKARELVGYQPQVDLDSGLVRTYNWYQQRVNHNLGKPN